MAPGALENGQQLRAADSTALVRSLLPTVHHPVIEYNIPMVEVERYSKHYNFFSCHSNLATEGSDNPLNFKIL